MNRGKQPNTNDNHLHWDNELSKAVPFMKSSMSLYDGFYGSAVVPWTLDKHITSHLGLVYDKAYPDTYDSILSPQILNLP